VKEEKLKYCRKCLLSETDPDGIYRSVTEYVASLDVNVRCDAETYSARLAICHECDHLSWGMCVLCGCYVEARAAKKKQNCPALPHKW